MSICIITFSYDSELTHFEGCEKFAWNKTAILSPTSLILGSSKGCFIPNTALLLHNLYDAWGIAVHKIPNTELCDPLKREIVYYLQCLF